ncbi:hypothetical protein XENOCAPTIV_030831 [Xenoophorus captivus]|uniref:Uncharacterized protein n=1 Tax=Xenoophorus captivus TaxID=1517983 RepID=A0ABV0RP83_9TELE
MTLNVLCCSPKALKMALFLISFLISLGGVIHFGRTVEHAQLNRHRSSDVTRDYKPAGNNVSWPFPACLTGRRNGGAYLERQKLQANFCSTRPFLEELESWKSV